MKLGNVQEIDTTSLLVAQIDALNTIIWQNSGAKPKNKPKSLFDIMKGSNKKDKVTAFSSAEEFEQRKREILGK